MSTITGGIAPSSSWGEMTQSAQKLGQGGEEGQQGGQVKEEEAKKIMDMAMQGAESNRAIDLSNIGLNGSGKVPGIDDDIGRQIFFS
ncbi:hypothetical protein LVW35_05975 [Pseudomonas sp. HN11]|uniref:hypothetical protein n=1 Tax=Pseudomonas sp. HN11 TaxID=1344094 RepID=UPI001F15DD77|nr:hypothetical protein [Pseudomonas sp. HN11]UII72725.1 hypothetical protein LVW35_05975 [Pseudomonas sp. HN11]